ncbi:hypothetical protein DM02DRAFT_631168 [Periconia macrospinosa]|uniref:PH domain-containing protein n=1 Tax=Periconia macrospinosa TaxID=97972 RepID=A0A2V1DJR9_9PLEO|nr:hypothetical protein DM02DRAFT_631168 [Periconia macrospinosa]
MATPRVDAVAAGLDPESYTALRLVCLFLSISPFRLLEGRGGYMATLHPRTSPHHLSPVLRRAYTAGENKRKWTNARACDVKQEGWLKTHRRDWYKHHLHINYSTRTASFTSPTTPDRRSSKQRRLTGFEGPSSSALFQHSFPQPEDADELEEDSRGKDTSANGNGETRTDAKSTHTHTASASSKLRISPSQGQVMQKEIVGSPETDVFLDAESGPESEDDDEEGDQNLRVFTHQEEADESTDEPARHVVPRPPIRTQSSTKSYVTASSEPEGVAEGEEDTAGAEEHNGQIRGEAADANNSQNHAKDDQMNAPNAADQAETEEQASSSQVSESAKTLGKRPVSTIESSEGPLSPAVEDTSTTSLLRNTNNDKAPGRFDPEVRFDSKQQQQQSARGILTKIRGRSENGESSDVPSPLERAGETLSRRRSNLRNLVKFDIPEDSKRAGIHLRAKQAQMTVQRASTKLKRRKIKDGLVVKMERMLVRVDATTQDVPDEYDENANQKIDSRVKDKWREYMVVCRHSSSDDAEFVLQMYKTRVIPEIENPNASKRAAYNIPLGRKVCKVNLYSSLDKSVVVWMPSARGTLIFIMEARTASNAVEWYTFLRNIMGWRRSSELQINVPDLSISLRIADPFKSLEASQIEAQEATDSDNEEAILRTMQEEQAVAASLIRRCLDQLRDAPEWADVLESWTKNHLIGLAWKRYDRLEWIHGANERKMYGTIAMSKSHDLELRPKSHYPTTVITRKKHKTLTEPVPVEGFLIRLTSQRGQAKRLGLMFHKQLYFASHDQFFVFSRPTNATPPPPPKLRGLVSGRGRSNTGGSGISAASLAEQAPDTWEIDPYPVRDGQVEWLAEGHRGTPESIQLRDEEAADEAGRKACNILNCDGYINLANVVKVRKAKKGASPVDANIESGSDVDFDEAADDTAQEDGVTHDLDMERTFELVMANGLIIRLQAADKPRRKAWITHLRQLVKYWRFRHQADIALYKTTRARNLSALNIDEEGEAYIGQFAKKWEVTQSYASPLLYNMCGIAACRSIHMSGTLYRKPRIHAPFTRCSVLLAAGTLVVFQDVLRSRTGKQLAHIHHERIANLDLKDCYVYSGLLTESDLLYQNQTFDPNKPGHHALPRIYLDDGGWTSTDEDVMTTFVVWHGKSKSWFRSAQEGAGAGEAARKVGKRGKLKRVAKLGSKGRSLVFRARSRAERDHWVLAVKNEIERVAGLEGGAGVGGAGVEDVRIEEVEGES